MSRHPHFYSFRRTALASLLVSSSSLVHAFNHHRLNSRNIIDASGVSESYDFVIVGGGLAGLVTASRLSEDSALTVLVLEAGGNGDDVRDRIDHPGLAYFNGILSEKNWGYTSVPQPNAGNAAQSWPMGKVLGGSSAANGCYLVRPGRIEVDAWHGLVQGMEGADYWTSDSFFDAMDRSETFTPPIDSVQEAVGGAVTYDASDRGSSGPLHASYPGYLPSIAGLWGATLADMGEADAYITTSTINPTNWTRSYSRTAYIDPYYRPNLHILTDAHVTRVLFDGTKAVGVEYGSPDARSTVNANKEVILSAGPMGSPATLMRSGVGPRDVLEGTGIPVVLELPGVGQHLQDHIASQVVFRTTAETARQVYDNPDDPRSRTPEFLSYVNSAIAYVDTNQLLGDAQAWNDQVMQEYDVARVPSGDPTVQAGYRAVYEVAADGLLRTPSGQIELLLSTTGSGFGADTVQVQAALQRPFSHGFLYLNTSDPFAPPVFDPGYFTHPADLVMLREGLKLARRIGETDPMRGVIVEELSPGPTVGTDEEWDAWIVTQVHTEFHPSCSCSMLPLDLGGVVDAKLRVHGLQNIRVVDSSVFPIEFAAHAMAPTYGLAEQAAVIIKSDYGSNAQTGGNNGGNGGNGGNNNGNNAGSTITVPIWTVLASTLVAFYCFF